MSLVNTLTSLYLRGNLNRTELYLKYPDETQFKVFSTLVKKAAKTEFGRQYGFDEILKVGPSEFAARVPLNPYSLQTIWSWWATIHCFRPAPHALCMV